MNTNVDNAEAYDFVHPEHKIKSDWPVLNLVSKKVAVEFESNLFNQFQFPIAVTPHAAKISKHEEHFTDVGEAQIVFSVTLSPMLGNAWLCIDRELIYALAETFFGGTSDSKEKVQDATLSHTEKRLCQYFCNCLQEALPLAWNIALDLHNPIIERVALECLTDSSDDRLVAVCNYDLKIVSNDFNIQLVYPYSMLEPHQKKLQKINQPSTVVDGFSGALKEELMNCKIDMHAVLAETKITLAEFLELKTGDFIPLRDIENVSFKSNAKTLFDARVGTSNGQVSASLSRWYAPGES